MTETIIVQYVQNGMKKAQNVKSEKACEKCAETYEKCAKSCENVQNSVKYVSKCLFVRHFCTHRSVGHRDLSVCGPTASVRRGKSLLSIRRFLVMSQQRQNSNSDNFGSSNARVLERDC